jgi:multidrug efflux pump subunit AcrB
MRIWLDPERLAKLGLTASDVIAAVREQNVQIAAGRAGSPPAPGACELELRCAPKGRLSTVEDFEQIVIRAEPGGSLLHLGDVARVELGAQSYAAFTRVSAAALDHDRRLPAPGGQRARRRARREGGAGAPVASASRPASSRSSATTPRKFVAESINEVMHTLFAAIALVFLVVYVFLEDWRATLIPAVTIPSSLIGTLAMLYAIGFGINFITLFALVLAIGLVVDDAIVVVENVARLMSEGYPRREAVLRSMGEVTSAIVAATLVLGAVFTPVALLPGTTGVMLRHFGVAVTVRGHDLVAQRAHALACAVRARDATRARAQGGVLPRIRPRLRRRGRALRPRRARAAAAPRRRARSTGVLFVANLLLFRSVPTAFIPDEDQGYFITSFQLPDGASIERTDAVARQVEKILLETPGVVGLQPVRRLRRADGTSPPNFGSVFVYAGAVERADREGPGDRRGVRAHASAVRRDPGRARARAEPDARARPLARGRLRVRAPGPRRRNRRGLAAVDAADHRRGEQDQGAAQPVHAVPSERAADPRRPRPRQGEDARRAHRFDLRDPPDVHGRHLHQRLRPLRAAVPRVRAGRGRSAQRTPRT